MSRVRVEVGVRWSGRRGVRKEEREDELEGE